MECSAQGCRSISRVIYSARPYQTAKVASFNHQPRITTDAQIDVTPTRLVNWTAITDCRGELYAHDRKSQCTLAITGSHQCTLMPTTKYGYVLMDSGKSRWPCPTSGIQWHSLGSSVWYRLPADTTGIHYILLLITVHRHQPSPVQSHPYQWPSAFNPGIWECLGVSGMSVTDTPRRCQFLAPELYLWVQTAVFGARKPLQHPDIHSSAIYIIYPIILIFMLSLYIMTLDGYGIWQNKYIASCSTIYKSLTTLWLQGYSKWQNGSKLPCSQWHNIPTFLEVISWCQGALYSALSVALW